jgi:hypothetical protein
MAERSDAAVRGSGGNDPQGQEKAGSDSAGSESEQGMTVRRKNSLDVRDAYEQTAQQADLLSGAV